MAAAPQLELAHLPAPPIGLSKKQLKHWYRTQERLIRSARRHADANLVKGYAAGRDSRWTADRYDDRPLEQRVIAFRRSTVRFIVLTPLLLAVNAAAGGPP